MLDPLTSPESLKNGCFFSQEIVRNDQCDVLANSFLTGVLEYALGALVPAGDNAIEPLTDDGIV